MVTAIPSRVSPLPGWSGPIQPHGGINTGGSDMMVTPGTKQPIVSITNGTVIFTSTQQQAPNSGGNSIEIKGLDGLYYYYAHMAAPSGLKPGDTVKTGQQLGIVGSTGNASPSAPHLHIGIGKSISTGVGAAGGIGEGFNAVALLKDLQARANIPELASVDVQQQIKNMQGSGTISISAAPSPVTQSLKDRILWLTDLLRHAGVPPQLIPRMVAVSLAENNSSNPSAISSTGDYGLWQINWEIWKSRLVAIGINSAEDLKDPIKNSQAAAFVLANQGINAWVTAKLGLDAKWQPDVDAALAGIDISNPGDTPTPGSDVTPNDCTAECPKWVILDTPHVEIPDLGCVAVCAMGNLITEWKKRWLQFWDTWQYETGYNYAMIVFGVVFVIVALAQIASENVAGYGGIAGLIKVVG
jgi:hypothetical protein